MGWWSRSSSSPGKEVQSTPDLEQPVPSKFNHDYPLQPPTKEQQLTEQQQQQQQENGMSTGQQFHAAVESISLEDFRLENLVKIPCFRNAGLTGFSTFFVFFPIMLIYHKNVLRATHWAVGGFFIGSILGWEQCQSIQKKSLENVRIAQEVYQKKQELKYQQMVEKSRQKKE